MVFDMSLRPDPFEKIRSGQKIYELRLYDEKRSHIKVGDTIRFTNTEDENEVISCKVEGCFRFNDFREMYDTLSLLECGYTEETVRTASYKDMEQFYSLNDIQRYGTMAIKIKLIK